VFDGQLGYLDHALANSSMTPQVSEVAEWHINADEIPLFDYNDDVRDPGESSFEEESDVLPLYQPDAFRSSDHDPVIIGLDLEVFDFDGLLGPVANPPALNEVKAGRAVPIEFGLGSNEGLDVVFDGFPRSQQVDCSTLTPLAGGDEIASPGGANLTYDPSSGLYSVPWKTDKAWKGTCRVFRLLLVDGSEHIAYFRFG
jgi:hypothetical protein